MVDDARPSPGRASRASSWIADGSLDRATFVSDTLDDRMIGDKTLGGSTLRPLPPIVLPPPITPPLSVFSTLSLPFALSFFTTTPVGSSLTTSPLLFSFRSLSSLVRAKRFSRLQHQAKARYRCRHFPRVTSTDRRALVTNVAWPSSREESSSHVVRPPSGPTKTPTFAKGGLARTSDRSRRRRFRVAKQNHGIRERSATR